MAVKKTSARHADTRADKATAQKNNPVVLAFVAVRGRLVKIIALQKINSFLSIVFYVIWILIGLFIIWFIFANFKLGAFDQLIGKPRASAQTQDQTQAPTETDVPGIGRVNIQCVQTNLQPDAIQKIVQDKSEKNLTDDEKKKLAECKVAGESTPAASSSPNK